MDGLASVQARIAEIQSRFGSPAAPATSATGDFASLLASKSAGGRSLGGTTATGATGKAPSGSGRFTQFALDLLARLGMPQTSENVRAVTAWAQAEGTDAANNPLATTQAWNGDSRFNSAGVRNYATYDDGLDATVRTLRNGRYGDILAALAAGNSAEAVGRAVAASPWGTGEGVLRVLGA